jgi:hypothetical protein
MRVRPTLVLVPCAVLLLAGSVPTSGQARPNFSGEWSLLSPAEPPAETPRALSVEHDATHLSITKTIGDRLEKVEHRLNPSTVGGTVGAGGGHTFAGIWWFGDILRFDNGSYSTPLGTPGKYSERSEAWSIDDKGLLNIQITRASDQSRSRVTLVYRKRDSR